MCIHTHVHTRIDIHVYVCTDSSNRFTNVHMYRLGLQYIHTYIHIKEHSLHNYIDIHTYVHVYIYYAYVYTRRALQSHREEDLLQIN